MRKSRVELWIDKWEQGNLSSLLTSSRTSGWRATPQSQWRLSTAPGDVPSTILSNLTFAVGLGGAAVCCLVCTCTDSGGESLLLFHFSSACSFFSFLPAVTLGSLSIAQHQWYLRYSNIFPRLGFSTSRALRIPLVGAGEGAWGRQKLQEGVSSVSNSWYREHKVPTNPGLGDNVGLANWINFALSWK